MSALAVVRFALGNVGKSGGGPPHLRNLAAFQPGRKWRQLLESASPLALSPQVQTRALPPIFAACPMGA